MKYNYLRKLILLVFPLLLYSCGTIKDGFSNQKKASSDEFLVETIWDKSRPEPPN